MSPLVHPANNKVNMIILYNILLFIGIIFGLPFIIPMILLSDKRRKTVFQRLGLIAIPHIAMRNIVSSALQKPVWIHALSVGEVLSAIPLVKRLKENFRNKPIYFSVSTKTGFEIANQFLKKETDAIFFYPYDLLFSVRHITNQVAPELFVLVETDIWLNFLSEMKKRNIPVILVNARLSKRSYSGYKRFSYFTKHLFLNFSRICTQSEADARRFHLLGVPDDLITVTGNIKFDQVDAPVSETEIQNMKNSMNIRQSQKIILAGSTHDGEEAIIFKAFSKIKERYKDILLIIAPRDPKRANSLCQIFKSAGFSVKMMSENFHSEKFTDVIIVDVMGILRKLYAIADIAFVGGSLVPCGGHNPLEPAAYSKPILFGHDMSDFKQIAEMLLESGGAIQVKDADDIYHIISELLEDEDYSEKTGKEAFKVFFANKGAVEKTVNVIIKAM